MLVLSAEVLFDLMFEIKDRGVTVDGPQKRLYSKCAGKHTHTHTHHLEQIKK